LARTERYVAIVLEAMIVKVSLNAYRKVKHTLWVKKAEHRPQDVSVGKIPMLIAEALLRM
jgi:hypothetical protein